MPKALGGRWGARRASPSTSCGLAAFMAPAATPSTGCATGRRLVKPGQAFNRIHVDDIAAAVETVAAAGRPGAVYNVVDGAPSAPQDMIAYAAALLGVAPPPEEPIASAGLTGMAASFYQENRRVRNAKLRALGWTPRYPTYREGLAAVLADESGLSG